LIHGDPPYVGDVRINTHIVARHSENVKIFVKESFRKNIFRKVENISIMHNVLAFGTMKHELEKERIFDEYAINFCVFA